MQLIASVHKVRDTLVAHFQDVTEHNISMAKVDYAGPKSSTFLKLTTLVLNRQLWAQFIASVHKVRDTLAAHFQEVTIPQSRPLSKGEVRPV